MKSIATLTLLSLLFLFGCQSVEKYNGFLDQKIEPNKLKEDVSFAEKKLFNMQPDIHFYVTEEKLHHKFDSLSQTLDSALTPNEFFLKISPIVGGIHQGHTSVYPLQRKLTKTEKEKYKDSKGPFSFLDLFWQENHLYVTAYRGKDSLVVGSEILKINGVDPIDIYQKYKPTENSDGYNQTFINYRLNKRFDDFYTLDYGLQDSLFLSIKKGDKKYNKTIYRVFSKKNTVPQKIAQNNTSFQEKKTKDTLFAAEKWPISVSKIVSKKDKKKKKKLFGYNSNTKKFSKELDFPTSDSSVAVLYVRNFTQGIFKKAYKEIFQTIKDKNVENLILDVRGNSGGFIRDANDLYTYLSDEKQFTLKGKVNSKTEIGRQLFRNKPKIFYPFLLIPGIVTSALTHKIDSAYYFKVPEINKDKKDLRYTGNLYVLIDGGSYSATCLLASNLKGSQRGFFVGEETGGAYNGTVAGFMPEVKLPNSKLDLQIGIISLVPFHNNESEFGRGIFPDKEIKTTVEDKIKNKDAPLHWVLEKIKSDKIN